MSKVMRNSCPTETGRKDGGGESGCRRSARATTIIYDSRFSLSRALAEACEKRLARWACTALFVPARLGGNRRGGLGST